MPRALEPGQSYRVVLQSDQDKPKESQPAFLFRAATAREWRQVVVARSSLEAATLEAQLDATLAALKITLVGWQHMDRPYCAEDLDAVVGPYEAAELLSSVVNQGQVAPEDKKKSDSSPSCSPASSADSAEEESA
jgi:hypothetical protein